MGARHLASAIAACAMVLTTMAVPASAATLTPVIETSADTYSPAFSTTYLTWVQKVSGDYGLWARPRAGGATWRVNAVGTEGWARSAVWGTDTIAYQQYTRSTSDIYLYNLQTRHRTKLGAKVNTSAWEYSPVASDRYVLFFRYTQKGRLLLLFDRKTNTVQQLGNAPLNCSWCLRVEWVGESHAIYTQRTKNYASAKTKIWTRGHGVTTLPDQDAPYHQYGAAMDEATGDVYYVFSTKACGLFVELRRWNIAGGSPTTIYDLPEGIDASNVSLGPSLTTPGDIDLVFDDWDCLYDDSDIYSIESVNTIT